MAIEFIPEFYVPDTTLRVVPEHPFVEAKRLFIFRLPYQDAVQNDPGLVRPENRSASRARDMIALIHSQLDAFESLSLPTEIIELDTAPEAAVMANEFTRHNISSSDAVLWEGGDGRHSEGDEAAHLAGFAGINKFVGTGNARDLAHMLFSRRDITDPIGAMLRSREATLNPVEARIHEPGQPKDKAKIIRARGYWSAGSLLEEMARAESSTEVRIATASMGETRQLIWEANLTRHTIKEIGSDPDKLIIIEDNDGARTISDVLFPNGERMAKVIRFGRMQLLRPGFGRIELHQSTLSSVGRTLGRAALGAFPHYGPEEKYEFRVSTQSGEPIRGMRDGEPFSFESGSTVIMGISERGQRHATTASRT